MKILSVKIENLASIASTEINFNEGILKNHPVFAITGKTGVGKSTILDAICLGIYGKTPRYDKIGGVDLEEKLKGNSPTNILRRGCGKGSATVNFYGIARVEYQAVWKVQRARANANGLMQMPEHELYQILDNGERKSIAQKSQVKEKIIEVTGLSFEQFRHAVLLPQGEFRAFLEAKSDDRATLLEKLTGTDIYGEISKVAYKRYAEKESYIRLLRSQIENILILSDEELAQLQQNILAVEVEISALNQRKINLEVAEKWYLQNEKDKVELQNREGQLSEITQEIEKNSTAFAELTNFDHGYKNIFPSWQELKRLKAELVQQSDRLTNLSREKSSLENELTAAIKFQAEKALILAEREEFEKKQQPQIILARELDTKILDLQKNKLTQEKVVATTQQNLTNLNSELATLKDKSETIELQRVKLQNSLAELSYLQPIFENRELIVGNLNSWDRYKKSINTKQVQLQKIKIEMESAKQKEADLQKIFEQSSKRILDLNNQILTLENELSQFDLEQLNQQIITNQKEIFELKNSLALQENLCKEEKLLEQNRELKATSEEEFKALTMQIKALERVVEELQNSLTQQRENYQSATLAMTKTANDLRTELRSNQPCPVCGSKEHPYQQDLPHLNSFLASLQEQINSADAKLKSETILLKDQESTLNLINNKIIILTTNITNSEEKINTLKQQLEKFLTIKNPTEKLLNLSKDLETAQNQQQATLKIQQQLSQIRQTLQKATKDFSLLQERISEANDQINHWHTQEQVVCQEILNSEQELTTLTKFLTAKLNSITDLEKIWQIEPAKAVIYINEKDLLFSSLNGEIKITQEKLQELAEQKINISGQLQPINQQLIVAENSLTELVKRVSDLQEQRKVVLDGKSADEVATALQSAVQNARSEKEITIQKYQDLTQLKSKFDTEITLLSSQQTKNQAEIEKNIEVINQYLSSQQKSIEQLEALFSQPTEYYDKLRNLQKSLHDRRENISGGLTAMQTAMEDHLKNRPKILFSECSELPIIATNLAEKGKISTSLQAQQINDTNQRTGQANQLAKIKEAEAEILIWREINEAIGSADGKKFREYAQGINLSILLANANLFLQQLRNRYELQRHRNSMEIVLIDKDLCNAVRPVNSLSGGESFLVSMSLALGLSTMASGKISINSLFIDEGFGTLDEETLSVVLEVLQSLHQMGKQVGIISHVPDIAGQIGAEIHLERVAGVAKVEIRN